MDVFGVQGTRAKEVSGEDGGGYLVLLGSCGLESDKWYRKISWIESMITWKRERERVGGRRVGFEGHTWLY